MQDYNPKEANLPKDTIWQQIQTSTTVGTTMKNVTIMQRNNCISTGSEIKECDSICCSVPYAITLLLKCDSIFFKEIFRWEKTCTDRLYHCICKYTGTGNLQIRSH